MKNFKEGYRALSRIKLMMAYDLKKTLNENKKSIEEQFGYSYQQGLGMDKESQERRQKEYQKEYQKDKDESYPNYCSAKDKAVSLSGFKSPNGLEGLEALPKGFCAYRQPYPNCKRPEIKVERLQGTQFDIAVKDEPKSKEAYILLPKDAKIEFYNSFVDLSNAFDVFLSSLDSEDSKNLDSKLALKEFTNIIPVGVVRQFTIGSTTYLPFVCYDIAPSGKVDFMSFGGYKNNKNEVWENPFVKDDRSEYQRFVDEWGTVIQWTAVIVTAIAGIACDGCTFPIMLEILTELGIGFAVGYREWEKGNEVAAALSFITGMLPFLKLIPGFRGMNPQAMNKLMDSWKNSGLATTSTIDKYIDWYKSLDEDAQLVLNQMLRADEVGKNTFLGYTSKQLGEELSEIAFSKFDDVLKSDPNLLRKIPFTSRLWVRELGTNATVTLAAMIVDAVWGDKLNTSQSKDLTEEMRDKLDGIYDVVPERLKNEMTVNIMGNLYNSKNVIEDPEMKDIKDQAELLQQKNMTNALSVFWQKSQQRVFSENGATYVPIEDVPMVSGEDLELSPEEENEFRKRGWLPAIESNRDVQDGDSLQMINKMIWIKPKNK